MNRIVLSVTAGVSLLSGIATGLVPAAAAARVDVQATLKGPGGGRRSGPPRYRLAKSFVITQIALSFTLLIGGGLLLRTMRQLHAVDTGFERKKILTAWVSASSVGYTYPREVRLYERLLEQLNTIPGAQSASLTLSPIYQGAIFVGPRFFRTEGIELVAGREFLPSDNETAPRVSVISESLAREFFSDKNPIGQHFEFEPGGGFSIKPGAGDIQVIGIARDIRRSLWDQEWLASFYLPAAQAPPKAFGQAELLIRAAGKPSDLVASVSHEIQSVDKDLALADIKTQGEEMDQVDLGTARPVATLLSLFAALALALTLVGIYGLVSFAAAQRTQEFGIRMALGATRGDVLRLVIRQGLTLTTIGVGIGLLASFIVTRLLKAMLFGVSATDPLTFSLVALLLSVVSLLACYLPARRATTVDPMVALRSF